MSRPENDWTGLKGMVQAMAKVGRSIIIGRATDSITNRVSENLDEWGYQRDLHDAAFHVILTKQAGDVSRAVKANMLSDDAEDMLRSELVQLAAFTAQWIIALDMRGTSQTTPNHTKDTDTDA